MEETSEDVEPPRNQAEVSKEVTALNSETIPEVPDAKEREMDEDKSREVDDKHKNSSDPKPPEVADKDDQRTPKAEEGVEEPSKKFRVSKAIPCLLLSHNRMITLLTYSK